MGVIGQTSPVMLLVGAFSATAEALDWSRENLQESYGPLACESERFHFAETRYYEASMGAGLLKQFFAFTRLIEPELLVNVKHQTNALEATYQGLGRSAVARPLNLDPGYLNEGKLVLASTKDHAHRLYLGRGIYGEVTLRYEGGHYVAWPWTYPDYQRADYHAFFEQVRADYRRRLAAREDG